MPSNPSSLSSAIRARRHRAVLPAILAVLLCLAVGGTVLCAQEKPPKKKPPSNPEQKPPDKKSESGKPAEPKNGVVLTGHLSRDSARPDGKIRFWITVENGTSGSIRNLHVADFFIPGFERPPQLYGGCSGASWGLVCGSLAPQGTVTIWGDLSAAEPATKENAYAVLVWDSDTRSAQSSVVQLGEVERLSWYAAAWRWLAQLDVGLPTLTALLVGLYGLLKNRKEKREGAAKEALSKKEAVEKEQREQHQQTWNLMLPQANKFSLKYYIPSANAIITAIYHLTECRKNHGATDENLLAALFDLVQFQWQRLRMKRVIGGYYFKSRTAEGVMEGLFQKHRAFFEVTTASRLLVLTKFAKPFTTQYEVDDFRSDRAKWDNEQKAFWQEYVVWVRSDNCLRDIEAMGAMAKVLWYESNRPFLNWYQEQPPVILTKEERELIEAVGNELAKDGSDSVDRVRKYIAQITTGVDAIPMS
jgi:hypothetical protein